MTSYPRARTCGVTNPPVRPVAPMTSSFNTKPDTLVAETSVFRRIVAAVDRSRHRERQPFTGPNTRTAESCPKPHAKAMTQRVWWMSGCPEVTGPLRFSDARRGTERTGILKRQASGKPEGRKPCE